MLNLNLFTKLQEGNTAFLLLRQAGPGKLVYFMISSSVNYNIVTSGDCLGDLPNGESLSFDVSLSSITPLLNKKQVFRLSYKNSVLRFEDVSGRYYIEPLCVEHNSEVALVVAKKYQDFIKTLSESENTAQQIEEGEQKLKQLRSSWQDLMTLNLYGVPPSNPFETDIDVQKKKKADEFLEKRIKPFERKLQELRNKHKPLVPINMQDLKQLATAAAKYNTTISLCDNFALVSLPNSFLLQKIQCGVRAVQGKLLLRLLQDTKGKFYTFEDDIAFVTFEGDKSNKSTTVVFLLPYLPNVSVDESIVKKGSVKEKYSLNLKGMLPVVQAVLEKFETMEFNMGSSFLELTNSNGERFRFKFSIEDAKTVELIKAMRGEDVHDIKMSTITIPREIQKIIGMFSDNFTVYVKERKVVLQSSNIYAVFGR